MSSEQLQQRLEALHDRLDRQECASTRLRRISRITAVIAGLAIMGAGALAIAGPPVVVDGQPPPTIPYHGYLEQNGRPLDGTRTLRFELYDAATAGTRLWGEDRADVAVTAGRFGVELGATEAFPPAVLRESTLFVQISVLEGGTPVVLGRQRLLSVPFALSAANGVPPGTIVAFGGGTPPPGWVLCDGQAVDREDPQFVALWEVIGTNWGNGTTGAGAVVGTTDFNLPDLRGRFLRGVDHGSARDPDRAARAPGAAGGLMGDNVGSVQSDAFQGHAHNYSRTNYMIAGASGSQNFDILNPPYTSVASSAPIENGFGPPRTSRETRPTNANVDYIIKL